MLEKAENRHMRQSKIYQQATSIFKVNKKLNGASAAIRFSIARI